MLEGTDLETATTTGYFVYMINDEYYKPTSIIGATQGNNTEVVEKRPRQGKTNSQWTWMLLAAPVLEFRMNTGRIFPKEGSQNQANRQRARQVHIIENRVEETEEKRMLNRERLR